MLAREGRTPDCRLSFQWARSLFAELTPSRLELLDTLRRVGPRPVDELARQAERNPITVGVDVVRLGELGLIDQAPDVSVSVLFDAAEILVPLAVQPPKLVLASPD